MNKQFDVELEAASSQDAASIICAAAVRSGIPLTDAGLVHVRTDGATHHFRVVGAEQAVTLVALELVDVAGVTIH